MFYFGRVRFDIFLKKPLHINLIVHISMSFICTKFSQKYFLNFSSNIIKHTLPNKEMSIFSFLIFGHLLEKYKYTFISELPYRRHGKEA